MLLLECDVSICLATSRSPKFARAVVGLGYDKKGKIPTAYLVIVFANRHEKFAINRTLRLHSKTIEINNRYIMLQDVDKKVYDKLRETLVHLSQRKEPWPLKEMTLLDKLINLRPGSKKANLTMDNIKKKDAVHENLKELMICDISSMSLIPKQTFALQRLTQLSLVKCHLTNIPRELAKLARTLKVLKLNSNQIREIPRWFFPKFKNLLVLELSDNELYSIPNEVAISSTLQRLDLSFNQLNSVPAMLCYKMFAMAQYEMVNLSNNQLYYLNFFGPHNHNMFRESKSRSINICNNLFHLSEEEVEIRYREIEPYYKHNFRGPKSLFFLSLSRLLTCKLNIAIFDERETPESIFDYFQKHVFFCGDCRRLKMGTASRTFMEITNNQLEESWVPRLDRSYDSFYSLSVTCETCIYRNLRSQRVVELPANN